MRVLITGWFSFEQMGASAGDLLCRDLVSDWLRGVGMEVVAAVAPPFTDGVRWEAIPPDSIDAVIFLCGPFGNGWPIPEFLTHFEGKRLVGFNLTMLQDLEEWNPFDVLFERDSSRQCRPDAVFLSSKPRVPVVGLILVHPQKEYGSRGLHNQANQALRDLAASKGAAIVEIDTRLDVNAAGLSTPEQVESLIAKMDLVLTTRLHGMVLAIKNGIPCVAIDPIAGGAKIVRQGTAIGWPYVFASDHLTVADLTGAWAACVSPQGRELASSTASRAQRRLDGLGKELILAVRPATTEVN